MTAAKLIRPSEEYKDSVIEAIQEFQNEGLCLEYNIQELEKDFKSFAERLRTERGRPHQALQEWVEAVPETVLWMVKDGEYLGTVAIRHRLNWHLERWGGHLHFKLRPSMRGKGFGRKMLLKAIPYANYLGIEKALVTVAPDNTPAIRVLESCGAEFIDELSATEQFPARRRYWMDCR